ncbi:hypothetical protein MT962_000654 [Franconibacter sp. IITDAS19]|uniref:hypothetical protein n=1 Tax=Franconibacter sp. IITDAS19 TaxID=2930569 RepID=UPI001FF8A67D|nr:hypothetical protein [Franconibacter sp. IITDAS19]MCK1966867.1 hypothetical protein [Franconibacter sp. IITDAS19]
MSVMLYKEGNGTRVWGKEYKTTIVPEHDVESMIAEGWHKHPDEVMSQKTEQTRIKRTRRTNSEAAEEPQEEVSDEHKNEG